MAVAEAHPRAEDAPAKSLAITVAASILNAAHAVHHCLSMGLLAYPW